MSDLPVVRRTVVKHAVSSRILPEGGRSLRVYLPPGYQETVSYPVVYCQDGEDFFNFGRIATISQRMILEEDWEPFVVVGVDVDKKLRTSEYMPGGSRHEAYTGFFSEEMLPDVEKHFSVRRTPEERLLAGDSLGASACLSLALKRPDLFTRVLSLSGAYYDASVDQADREPILAGLRVWMSVGLQETAFETDRGTFDFVALNRVMKRLLSAKGAEIVYSERDGEHKWGFWQQLLPEALSAFLGPSPDL
ncbi:esterase family protein [Cohnella sp. CFH 77786]|uniref:alpha/beta hydrolase n=1 Tax=Cohnella sp. CFH 77786 TaxID=2662265 RepID=UPI001C6095C9|nr:alpha/beta hydrolase-fold protein [Cohnella sp. CFH 77786]MBW5448156.1 esterase family protein [Cohnella sp. CFH 77786]